MKRYSKKVIVGTIVGLTLMIGQSVMAQTVAPYVDSCLGDVPDMVQVSKQTGINQFNLGFIVADTKGNPSWGGKYNLGNSQIEEQIKALRAAGGDVIISVGGATGTPLHLAIKDDKKLKLALENIVAQYDLDVIDFDIEGQGLKDLSAARRLLTSIKGLQSTYPALDIWLTLPVAKDGLTAEGKAVVDYAIKKGVDFQGINLMVMNSGYETSKESDMSDYAIGAAQSVVNQLDRMYKAYGRTLTNEALWEKIGLTPMIGVNDTGQIFTQEDAQQLVSFAKQKNIGYLGYWSLTRDKQGNLGTVSPTHSGVMQEPMAYTKIFAGKVDEIVGKEIKVLPIGENDVTETTAYFEWEELSDASDYVIVRDGARQDTTKQIEYTDSQLKSGTTYYYSVEGIGKDGKIVGRSKPIQITTKGQSDTGITPPTANRPSGSWQPGIEYKAGDTVTYDQKTYQCVMPHRALGDWQPSQTPALWTLLPNGQADANGTVWDVQVQYKAADVVTYNGKTYSCIQPHKSLPGWEPDKTPALWGIFKK